MQTDGCCYGNPGPAGAGVVIYRKINNNMQEILAKGLSIGPIGTNNIAEAIAFIIGAEKVIKLAKEHAGGDGEVDEVKITALLDSQIVVDMIDGRSMPKHPTMRKLMQIARRFADGGINVSHVRRNFN